MLVTATWLATSYSRSGAGARSRSASPRSSRSSISSRRSSPPASRGRSRARPCTRSTRRRCCSSRSRCSRRSSRVCRAPWPLVGALLALVVLIAWRAVASAQRVALLHRLVLRDRHAGGVVGDAPDARAPGHGRRRSTSRSASSRSACRSLARRASRPLQPAWGGGAVLLLGLALLFFLSLGPVAPAALWALGAAPRDHERRALRRERRRAAADRLAGGQHPLVDRVDDLVERAAGSVGVLPSLARRRRADARDARRAQPGRSAACDGDGDDGSGAVRARALPRAHRSSVPAAAGDGPRVGVAAVAGVRGAGRDHARRRAPRRSGAGSPPCTRPARLPPRGRHRMERQLPARRSGG